RPNADAARTIAPNRPSSVPKWCISSAHLLGRRQAAPTQHQDACLWQASWCCGLLAISSPEPIFMETSLVIQSKEIRTAVFPVAGRGTRFLPATKASPKEMLPVVDKPLIQYAVEEALAAGATRLVFVTGASKRAIEDHFDSDQELEHMLEAQGNSHM